MGGFKPKKPKGPSKEELAAQARERERLDAERKRAESQAERDRQERLAGRRRAQAGASGRRSLIGTGTELGTQDTLG